MNAEPFGSRRLPTLGLLDIRVEKKFRMANAHEVAVRLNVYNRLNANTATRVQPRSGASFLRPLEITPPRIAEIGASYMF